MDKVRRTIKAHPYRLSFGVAMLAVAGTAFFFRDVIRLAMLDDGPTDLTLPLAQPLEARPGEIVYRIDPSHSLVTVEVDEVLAGVDHKVAMTTQAIAGDLGISSGDPTTGRIGEILVDVHQLESDNRLRDRAVEHDFLETHNHRTVRLHDATISDVEQDSDGTATFAIEGTLDVKTVSKPIRFEATGDLQGNSINATAQATIHMDEFGVGPITKIGLVQTSNDVVLSLDILAVDARDFTPPVGLGETVVSAESGKGPAFSTDVQPILEASCAGCHESSAVGAQHWELDTAGDAADIAEGLAVVTETEYMPPWPPSDQGIELEHPRGLDDSEKRTIAQWAAAGGALDVARDSKIVAPEPETEMPRADLVLDIGEPYMGDGSQKDVYRCFVMDPEFTEPTAMTAFAFSPDATEVTHHVLTYKLPERRRADVDTKDAEDEGSGWACGDSTGGSGGELVGGWVPGQRPRNTGSKVGFIFQPGDFLITQIHYHYEGVLVPDQSSAALQLETDADSVEELKSLRIVAPVELPCPEGAMGELCDREAALVDASERSGGDAGRLANGLHFLCDTTIEEVAASSDGNTASTVCQRKVRQDARIVDVLGHMHEIGTEFRMTLNPRTDGEKTLLHIPVWNFAWQLNYQPVEAVSVKAGDVIEVECNWNRSLRFDPDPQYIFFAEGTEDEMCFSTVTVTAAQPVERADGTR